MSAVLRNAERGLKVAHEDNALMLCSVANVSVWTRWSVILVIVLYVSHRLIAFGETDLFGTVALGTLLLLANTWLQLVLWRRRLYPWILFAALGAGDAALVSAAVYMTGGFDSPLFALYYPVAASLAFCFPSIRLALILPALVALAYAVSSVTGSPSLGPLGEADGALSVWIAALFLVSMGVAVVTRNERSRRIQAVNQERALNREQIELSQTIHDTAAQSAYMIGLGIESALAAVDQADGEQVARLEATRSLSRLAMWDLRHPIDMGLILEGMELGDVLRSHAVTFSTITSVETRVIESGMKPELPAVTRGLLFSIAHNAMTNAHRHARASSVTIELDYGPHELRLAIADDGCGLTEDSRASGHGIKNMSDRAQQMGGHLRVRCGREASGTTVTCVVPYKCN